MPEPVNVAEYERLAEERLEPGAYGYFAGGAGDERTLRENVEAFGRWRLRPRVLVDVASCSTATTVLGFDVSMPILVAPVALQRMAHPDGEPGMARAAEAVGTIMCLSSSATATPDEVAAAAPAGRHWFQVYVFRDRGVTRAMVEQAAAGGFGALVVTVDTPFLGRRERDIRLEFALPEEVARHYAASRFGGGTTPEEIFAMIDPTLSWRDLEWLAGYGLPVLVKGVLTREDAVLSCEHGAAAVVVSNHGGRQLDGVPASLDALPEVVEAVDGRVEVLLDGGVRRGSDVLTALALGARAVLAGRAPLWGLAADGERGARRVLELLQAEFALALALAGCPSPAAVTRDHVARPV